MDGLGRCRKVPALGVQRKGELEPGTMCNREATKLMSCVPAAYLHKPGPKNIDNGLSSRPDPLHVNLAMILVN